MTDSPEIAVHDAATTLKGPDVLVVDHSSKLAGAELCLLDIVRGFGSTSGVFLFEDGPLRSELLARHVTVIVSGNANSFSVIKRDRTLARVLWHIPGLIKVMTEIIGLARHHDVIYANSQKAFVLAAPAAWLTRRPLVWHLHDILSSAHFGRGQRWLVVVLANLLARRVLVPSAAVANAFRSAGGRSVAVRIIPNGLDIEGEPSETAALRRELGLPNGFLFGVFSRIGPWKGQHIALAALAEMPAAHCVIVGAPLFGEHSYFEELQLIARRRGILGRVSFLGHRTDVHRIMRAVDAVVHPSVADEPFGRTVVEAMLCQKPIIAARNGALPEILEDGRAGILVPSGNVQALASALRFIAEQPGATRSMVEHAYFRAKRCYAKSRMVREVRDALASLATAGA